MVGVLGVSLRECSVAGRYLLAAPVSGSYFSLGRWTVIHSSRAGRDRRYRPLPLPPLNPLQHLPTDAIPCRSGLSIRSRHAGAEGALRFALRTLDLESRRTLLRDETRTNGLATRRDYRAPMELCTLVLDDEVARKLLWLSAV